MAGRIAGWVLLVGLVASRAEAEEPVSLSGAAVHTRVRTSSLRLKTLIDDGLRRSETFGKLAAAVLQTDGVVYVEEGKCYRGVKACLEWRVTTAGDHRLLFVRVGADRDDDDVIASIGHELQHALEVLRLPRLRTRADFAALYIPPSRLAVPAVVETRAAITMGDDILYELRRFGTPVER